MLGIAIILLFNLLGLLAQKCLGLPLPANVLGMIFLALALFSGLVKLAWVEPAANFLLRHMLLFFVPLIVSAVLLWPLLRENWLPLVGGMVFSTLITLAVTGAVATALTKPDPKALEEERP
ncbi:MAG: CidA/LrgA family protein [Phycisphaerae bacterium]